MDALHLLPHVTMERVGLWRALLEDPLEYAA